MRVALLNPTGIDHYSPCTRHLTSYLKMHGHEVRQIFLPADTFESRWKDRHDQHFSIKQLNDTMIEALKAQIEYRLSRFANDSRAMATAKQVADMETRKALELESRYTTLSSTGTRYSYMFRHLGGVITTDTDPG